jgi:diguanylate cyclase (GGDEF)-like protein
MADAPAGCSGRLDGRTMLAGKHLPASGIGPAGPRVMRNPHPLCCRLVAALIALGLSGSVAAAPDPNPAADLIERGTAAMRTDPEASHRDAMQALELLARYPDPDLEIRARLIACDYLAERDKSAAEQEAAKALALVPQATRKGLAAGVLGCQGEIMETAGNTAQARALYDQAVTVATDAEDEEMLAGALFQRGYILSLEGEYAAGLADLRQSQSLYEALGKPDHALTALNGIAILYNRLGDYTQAKDIYTQALKSQESSGLEREQAVTLHNLGRAHENLGEWGAARQAFGAALEIATRIDYPRGEAYSLRGLASVSNAEGEPRQALRTLARAIALQRQTPDARLLAQIQLAKGIALHRLGRYDSSVAALEAALAVFREVKSLAEIAATYAALADVYAAMGDWKSAYRYESRFKRSSDTLFNRQLDQRFATLKVEFDTAAKEKENELLRKANEANEIALSQQRRAGTLQGIVIGLVVTLTLLLATLTLRERRTSRRMQALAMTDELTGVPNRRYVLSRLEQLLDREPRLPCSILIIDIDHFKRINDTHGHPIGDQVLQIVASELRAGIKAPATIGRLGGEEFIVLLPATDAGQARTEAERIRERITGIESTGGFGDRITASLGVATSIPGRDSVSEMLRRADSALYAAKNAGRNCVRSWAA